MICHFKLLLSAKLWRSRTRVRMRKKLGWLSAENQPFWLSLQLRNSNDNQIMGISTHFLGQPILGQLLNYLNRVKILQISRDGGGERYVKKFNAWCHLAVMLYAFAFFIGNHISLIPVPLHCWFSRLCGVHKHLFSYGSTPVLFPFFLHSLLQNLVFRLLILYL